MALNRAVSKTPSLSMKDFDEFFGSQEEEEQIHNRTDQAISMLQEQSMKHRITLDRFVDVDFDDVEVESIHLKGDLSYFSNAKREVAGIGLALNQEKIAHKLNMFVYRAVVQSHLEIIRAKQQQFQKANLMKITQSDKDLLLGLLRTAEDQLAEYTLEATLLSLKRRISTLNPLPARNSINSELQDPGKIPTPDHHVNNVENHSVAPSSSLHSSPGTSPPATEKANLSQSFFGAMRKYTKGLTDLVEELVVMIPVMEQYFGPLKSRNQTIMTALNAFEQQFRELSDKAIKLNRILYGNIIKTWRQKVQERKQKKESQGSMVLPSDNSSNGTPKSISSSNTPDRSTPTSFLVNNVPPPSEPLQMSVNIPQPSELKARLSAHLEKEELAAKLASMQNSTNSSQPQQTSNEVPLLKPVAVRKSVELAQNVLSANQQSLTNSQKQAKERLERDLAAAELKNSNSNNNNNNTNNSVNTNKRNSTLNHEMNVIATNKRLSSRNETQTPQSQTSQTTTSTHTNTSTPTTLTSTTTTQELATLTDNNNNSQTTIEPQTELSSMSTYEIKIGSKSTDSLFNLEQDHTKNANKQNSSTTTANKHIKPTRRPSSVHLLDSSPSSTNVIVVSENIDSNTTTKTSTISKICSFRNTMIATTLGILLVVVAILVFAFAFSFEISTPWILIFIAVVLLALVSIVVCLVRDTVLFLRKPKKLNESNG